MLPNKALKKYYSKVSWLYVCRTFKKDAKDREALRTHDRFGISSWPHMFLFDPKTDAVLASSPRSLKGFIATFDRVLAEFQPPTAEALRAGKAIATELATSRRGLRPAPGKTNRDRGIQILRERAAKKDGFGGWLEARELLRKANRLDQSKPPSPLHDPDSRVVAMHLESLLLNADRGPITADVRKRASALVADAMQTPVVRIRAWRLLDKTAPDGLATHVESFLTRGNDPMRYAALEFVGRHPHAHYSAALVDVIQRVGSATYPSRNPRFVQGREKLEQVGESRHRDLESTHGLVAIGRLHAEQVPYEEIGPPAASVGAA